MFAALKRALGVPHRNDRPTSPYSAVDQGREYDLLCAECQAVAWSTIPSLQADGLITTFKHQTVRSLNARFAELVTSRCRICRILAHIKPASLDGLSCMVKANVAETVIYGVAQPFISLSLQPENDHNQFPQEQPSIALLESNYQHLNFGPRLLRPNIIDYDLIKKSVQYCDCSHHKTCPGSSGTVTVSGGLRVIDIRTRTVIEAPSHCRYAALSYVWGSQSGENALVEDLGSPPLVIEDSFTVCSSLGLEFLWVDRFVSCCLLSYSSEVITNSYNV